MCYCRIVTICKLAYQDAGTHEDVTVNRICPLCNSNSKRWCFHGESEDSAGSTLECRDCHNYILYYFSCKYFDDLEKSDLDKEEFYVDKFSIIKEENSFIILSDSTAWNDHIVTIPSFSFNNQDHLLKKLKTYITFL